MFANKTNYPFVNSVYAVNGEGEYFPKIDPVQCPFHHPGAVCRVEFMIRRHRATGPVETGVVRYYCRTHQQSFSVYPPGFGPWMRKILMPVDHEGRDIQCEEAEQWCDTAFEAASDAAAGQSWPRKELGSAVETGESDWHTQTRKLDRLLLLLTGKGKNLDRDMESIAAHFGIEKLGLANALSELCVPRSGYQAAGKLILLFMAVFTSQGFRSEFICDSLLCLGHHHRIWGKPFSLTDQGTLVPVEFPGLPPRPPPP